MSPKPCTLRCARVLRHHGGRSLPSAAAKKSALYRLGNFPINVKVFPNKKKDKMVTDELVKGCVQKKFVCIYSGSQGVGCFQTPIVSACLSFPSSLLQKSHPDFILGHPPSPTLSPHAASVGICPSQPVFFICLAVVTRGERDIGLKPAQCGSILGIFFFHF